VLLTPDASRIVIFVAFDLGSNIKYQLAFGGGYCIRYIKQAASVGKIAISMDPFFPYLR